MFERRWSHRYAVALGWFFVAVSGLAAHAVAGPYDGGEWQAKRVYLNTTSAGADVDGDVTDFPVLIRLTSDKFDFAAAQPDGADVRFANTDGSTVLPYEIVSWDGSSAQIWVRVDTVYGDNSTQSILLYWGNSSATSESCSECVFDTAVGFVGVWHLNSSSPMADATYNHNDLTDVGTAAAAGVLHGARDFGGTDTLKVASNSLLHIYDEITLSTWNNMDAWGGRFIRKYNAYDEGCNSSERFSFRLRGTQDSNDDNTDSPGGAGRTGQWNLWTATWSGDGTPKRLWRDTTEVKAETATGTISASGDPLLIGPGVDGRIDEVWLMRRGSSPDRMRLTWMNQYGDGRLVEMDDLPEPPTITLQPVSDTVTEGESVAFTLSATGSPPPSTQWRKDGTDIPGATGNSFTIDPVTLGDSGNYSAMVWNAEDTVYSQSVKLTVKEACFAAEISSTLNDTTAIAGTDLTLLVTASGSHLRYQWYHDGIAQPDDTLSDLTLAAIQSADAGQYWAVVYNECSADTTDTADVGVCVAPSLTSQPVNQDVIAETPAYFSVTAEGTGLSYQWYRDTGTGWQSVTGATASQYSLLAPLDFDNARFKVHVTGSCGDVHSDACTLFVSEACQAPVLTGGPRDTTVVENSQATFRVTATGTDLTYQWLRAGSQVSGATFSAYTFTPQRWHTGLAYRCVVTGQCGEDTSGTAFLTVTDTTRPHPITALTLNALGPNDINVKWSTPESDSTDADSVYVYYSSTAYQHYTSLSRTAVAEQAVSTTEGEESVDLGGLQPGTRYYFTVWLRDTVGNWAAADSDTVSTIEAGVPTNPVVVRGAYVDDTHVLLTLSNFCQLQSATNPFGLWAEYVGVWYQAGAFDLTPEPDEPTMIRLPLASMQAAAGCPGEDFDTLVALPALGGADSLYFFSVSVGWRNPDSVMVFTRSNGDSVLMRDVSAPENNLTISGTYPGGRSDSAFIALGNTVTLESKVTDVTVVCSFDTLLGDTIAMQSFAAGDVAAADPYTFTVRNSSFDGARRTVYCAVVLRSDQGVFSDAVRGAFEVGRDIPQNPVVLNALPLSSFEIALSWTSIAATGADSIRIWRDTVAVPLNAVDVSVPFPPYVASGTAVADTISGLNASTVYHFAAQARISGEWTAVSSASRAFASTLEPDPNDTIPNTAVVDTAWFDTTTNSLTVAWGYSYADSVFYGVSYGTDSGSAASTVPAEWLPAGAAPDTVRIELGSDILFDTTWFVFIRLRKAGGVPSGTTADACARVHVPDYTWEPVRYFANTAGDTVRAFNNTVTMWYEGTWGFGLFDDTVRAFRPVDVPAGLVPVSVGALFEVCDDGPALSIALRYGALPAGCTGADVRMYRRTLEGQWVVYHEYQHHGGQGRVSIRDRLVDLRGGPLILMVDTARPSVVVRSEIDSPVLSGTALLDTIHLSDQIANMSVTLLYSRAENAPRAMRFDTLNAAATTMNFAVPGGYVTEDAGARVYVVVSDGAHVDTINISRQVYRTEASDIATEAMRWEPLRTTADLVDSSMAGVLGRLLGGSTYDNTVCRVFRWFDPASTDGVSRGQHEWVEYNESRQDVFSLNPGTLLWMKTRDSRRPKFGAGVTTSLRDSTAIDIAPGNWTDVAVPYKFGICLGDILDATGSQADSLHYYHWVDGGDGVYATQVQYIATLVDAALRDRSTILSPGIRDGYSIYNPTDAPIRLVIPPTTHAMSSYQSQNRVLPKHHVSDGCWSLRLSPTVENVRELGTVVLGFDPVAQSSQYTYYALAPSFSDAGVHVIDPQTMQEYGHVVGHRMDGGGLRFGLVFYNNGSRPQTVRCAVAGLPGLPDSLQAVLADGAMGTTQTVLDTFGVTLAPKSREYRTLSVGEAGFHVQTLAPVKPFAQFVAYPNPFNRYVMVRFLLPGEATRAEFRVFDARGRLVWHHTEHATGRREFRTVWAGTGSNGMVRATGTYLLTVSALAADGRVLATRRRRLVSVR